MFNSISWSEYLTFISISVFVYYIGVVCVYFRQDISIGYSGRKNASSKASNFSPSFQTLEQDIHLTQSGENHNAQQMEGEKFQAFQSFMDEVQAYVEQAGEAKMEKDSLLMCVSIISEKYPMLAKSGSSDRLLQFIHDVVYEKCAISLSKGDLKAIWNER